MILCVVGRTARVDAEPEPDGDGGPQLPAHSRDELPARLGRVTSVASEQPTRTLVLAGTTGASPSRQAPRHATTLSHPEHAQCGRAGASPASCT